MFGVTLRGKKSSRFGFLNNLMDMQKDLDRLPLPVSISEQPHNGLIITKKDFGNIHTLAGAVCKVHNRNHRKTLTFEEIENPSFCVRTS